MLDVRPHVRGTRAVATGARRSVRTPSEVTIVWAIAFAVGMAALVTYWRLPPGATYHFADTGASGGLSRVVSYLAYPVALIAIAVAALTGLSVGASRPVRATAILAIALSASTPLAVSQSDLTARWSDALPVAGVLLAVAAGAAAGGAAGRAAGAVRRADRVRVAFVVLLAVCAVPWIAAALGFYISDAPVLGSFVRARQPTPGNAQLATIHYGLHDGLFGCQLAIAALLLSRALRRIDPGRLRTALSVYLGVLLVYGLALAASDAWDEQLVKRGTTSISLPDVILPSVSLAWLCLLLAAAAVHLFWFRRERAG